MGEVFGALEGLLGVGEETLEVTTTGPGGGDVGGDDVITEVAADTIGYTA